MQYRFGIDNDLCAGASCRPECAKGKIEVEARERRRKPMLALAEEIREGRPSRSR